MEKSLYSDENINEIDFLVKYKLLEARANIIGWYMLISFIFSVITPGLAENIPLLKRNNLTVKELVKYGFLPSCDETMQEGNEWVDNKNVFDRD